MQITDEDRETLKLTWNVIDTALRDVPGFGNQLPLEDWWRISRVLGRLALQAEIAQVEAEAAKHRRAVVVAIQAYLDALTNGGDNAG